MSLKLYRKVRINQSSVSFYGFRCDGFTGGWYHQRRVSPQYLNLGKMNNRNQASKFVCLMCDISTSACQSLLFVLGLKRWSSLWFVCWLTEYLLKLGCRWEVVSELIMCKQVQILTNYCLKKYAFCRILVLIGSDWKPLSRPFVSRIGLYSQFRIVYNPPSTTVCNTLQRHEVHCPSIPREIFKKLFL
jgi:hypothetical protein